VVRVLALHLSLLVPPPERSPFPRLFSQFRFFNYYFCSPPSSEESFQDHERLEVFLDGSPSIIRPTGWGLNKVLRKVGGFETACIGAYREKEGVLEYVWLYLLRLSLTRE
jgi:hypothetical protein